MKNLILTLSLALSFISFAQAEESINQSSQKICLSLRSAIIAANEDVLKAQISGAQVSQNVLDDLMAPYNKMNCGELVAQYDRAQVQRKETCKQIIEAQKVQIRNISAGKYSSISEANRKLDALYNRYDRECK